MSDTVIKVENLSKSYTISHQSGERYTALRDVLTNGVKTLGSRLLSRNHESRSTASTSSATGATTEEFWALNDVSFEIKQGERVGIIGRNGAGKSTLLKILSRITEPTKGRIHIKGRVASLLEVGTGFHPELTGRENISLNGAILGMSREEIRRKFDEIVAFAEVERFLDTPVKRYSSGMYVRLAFAVAAHLEPEILVVDEVLAVGDIEFQKKCLGKMGEVAREGRTVLFVSHNLRAVEALCESGILLSSGLLQERGPIEHVLNGYVADLQSSEICFPIIAEDIVIKNYQIIQSKAIVDHIDGACEFNVFMAFQVLRNLSSFRAGIYIKTPLGDTVSRSFVADWDPSLENIAAGNYEATITIPGCFLSPGRYTIHLHSSRYGIIDYTSRFNINKVITVLAPINFNQAHLEESLNFPILLKNEWKVNVL